MRAVFLACLLLCSPVFADAVRFTLGGSAFASASEDTLDIGAGVNFGTLFSLGEDSPLMAGFDVGYFQGTDIVAPLASMILFPFGLAGNWQFQEATVIPLLLTFIVRVPTGAVHPYGGISAGPVVMIARAYDLDSHVTETASPVYFMGVLRGGIDFDLSGGVGITLEPLRIGYFNNEWVFNPELAISFGI